MSPTPDQVRYATRLRRYGLTVVDWRTDDTPAAGTVSPPANRTDGTVCHHTVTNQTNAAGLPALMRSVWRFHVVTNGWEDLFYGVAVADDGSVAIGRGLDRATSSQPRAFTVVFVGDFRDHQPTPAARRSARLVIFDAQRQGVAPRILGHRQYTPDSACPGDALLAWVDELPDSGIAKPAAAGESPDSDDLETYPVRIGRYSARLPILSPRLTDSDHPAVAIWQSVLLAAGYLRPRGVTGEWDDRTTRATIEFRRGHGLRPVAVVTPAAWAAAFDLEATR
jgi:hypothetical protein